jgi:hypothetical protein
MNTSNISIASLNNGSSISINGSDLNEDTEQTLPRDYSMFFDFVVPGILLNIIGLLGLIGNTLSIIVLSRPQMRQSINCILIGLASFDSILIVTSILMLGLPAVYDFLYMQTSLENAYRRSQNVTEEYSALGLQMFQFYFTKVFPFITPTVYPIAMIVQTGSVYLTMAVTLERFVAVCLPFRSRSLCTYGRARYGVIIVALMSVIYNLPRFWEVKWHTTYPYGLNFTEYQYTEVIQTDLRTHPIYLSVYYTWAYLIFMFFIPFSCLAIFNLLIFRQVKIANSERSRMSRQEQKEIGLATMLMVVVIVFFLCNVLALVVNILELLFQKIFSKMININNLLVTLNSSSNFIIYCIFNDKFKRIFCKLFCCQMVLHKLGVYNNGAAGGPYTETYVHRYPENSNRTNATTISGPGNLMHNLHPMRGISSRQVAKIESSNSNLRNTAPHLNNNGSSGSNRGIEIVGMKNNKNCMETDTLLLNEGVLSDDEEFCSLTKDIHVSTRYVLENIS